MDKFKTKKVILIFEIIFFIFLGFFVGASTTTSPFYGDVNVIDEGQFAAWANFMLHGKLMFKDMYVVYGPLFVYPLYVLFKLLSPSLFIVRSYLVASALIGLIPANLIMEKLEIKLIPRTIMNFLIVLLPIMLLRQALAWIVILFLILSFIRQKKLYIFLTGLFTSLTFLTSPELGIIAGTISTIFYLSESIRSLSFRKLFFSLKYFLLGFTIPSLIFVVFSAKEGWLNAYLTATFKVLFDFSGVNVPNGKNLPDVFSLIPYGKSIIPWVKFIFSKELFIYYVFLLHIFFLLYLAGKFILRIFTNSDKAILALLIFGISLQYLIVGRPDHFFFALSPILVILIFYLNKLLLHLKNNRLLTGNKIFFTIVLLLLSIFCLRLLYINHPQIEKIIYVPSAVISKPSNPQFVGPIVISKNQKNFFYDLQIFVNTNTFIKDKIFIFSDEPALYLILNRDNATKYVLSYAANLKPMRLDMLNDLKKNNPKFILIDKNAWNVDDVSNFKRLPEIITYIKQNYFPFKTIDGVIFYKNRHE